MKVLYLAATMDPRTGWGRLARELIEGCAARGVEAGVLTENASGYPGESAILGKSWSSVVAAPAVRAIVKKGGYDIVHSLEVNPYGITAYLALLGLPVRHVITATGAYSVRPLYRPTTSFITASAYRSADAVLCISEYVKSEIRKRVDLQTFRVTTLGVDVAAFSGKRFVPEKPFILSVGNLAHRKGYETSVAAFALIAERFPDLEYVIAGSVDETIQARCLKILQPQNLEHRVRFLGSVGDAELKQLYLSAELFMLTSINEDHHFEGFGLVFLEAAAAGLPVIGTSGNGIASAVAEGSNGLLVPQRDVQATADALVMLLSDPARKASFSAASIAWAQTNSWQQVAERHVALYKEILNGSAR